jgi:hypothetical protein
MKFKFVFLLICFNTLLLLLLLFIYKSNKNNNINKTESELLSYYFIDNIYTSLDNEQLKLDNEILNLIYNKYKVNDSMPIFIIKYSQYSCNACVDFIKNRIKKYFSNNNRVIYIASDYSNYHDAVENTIFLKKGLNLNIPADDTHIPYVFLLKKGVINHIFIPDKVYDEYFDVYLKEIINKFFYTVQ